jgi:hypothetical protein
MMPRNPSRLVPTEHVAELSAESFVGGGMANLSPIDRESREENENDPSFSKAKKNMGNFCNLHKSSAHPIL